MEKLLLDTNEAAAALGISRALFYRELLQRGRVRVTRIGRRTLVARDELQRLIDELQDASLRDE